MYCKKRRYKLKHKSEKITYLYKYRSLFYRDSKDEIILDKNGDILFNKDIITTLTEGKFYLSDPNKFNDPFDCWIPISTELKQNQVLEFLKNKNQSSLKKNIKETLKTDYKNDVKNFSKNFIKQNYILENQLYAQKESLSRFRIYCLSKTNKNILMWSHYAQNHEGICIGIKTHKIKENNYIKFKPTKWTYNSQQDKATQILYQLQKVKYSDNNEMLSGINILTTFDNEVLKCLYHKSKDWQYEEEYRIILLNNYINNQYAYLKPEDIGEIYFGIKTPNEVITAIRKKLKDNNSSHYNNIKFYKMDLKNGYYELTPKIIE